MKRLFILISFLLGASIAHAACSGSSPTRTAASAANADVQVCVTAAVNGDTILVPAGTVSYGTTAVDIPNTKCLTINGQGGVTISSAYGFTMEPTTTCESRITGFGFTSSGGNPPTTPINVTSTTSTYCYRIDHNTFSNTARSIFLVVSGNGPGLIDHNSFNGGGASEEIHNLGMGASSEAGWQDTIVPGGSQMVFIENNTFSTSSTTVYCSALEAYYGARTVARYNTLNYCQLDEHGTNGNIGVRWFEFYNNVFNNLNQNQSTAIAIRAGAGVIFGNTTTGNNSSDPQYLDIYYDGPSGTWPMAWQPGSGYNGYTTPHGSCSGPRNTAPIYIWANPALWTMSLNAGGVAAAVAANRDFFLSASQPGSMSWMESSTDTCSTTYTYTPYTYPHPLDTSGGSTVSQPQTPASLQSTVN